MDEETNQQDSQVREVSFNSKDLPREPIDILLVTYQRRRFLEQTIRSIKERTFYPHRIIVIDNASTDSTKDFLKHAEVLGLVDKIVWMPENVGQPEALNEGFKHVKSDVFVTTQDDLLPPDLRPCWLERLQHLFNEHYPDYGSICMRIERTKRAEWIETDKIIRNNKTMPSVFRMQKKSDLSLLGDAPFGHRKHWESHSYADAMKTLKKKFGMAVHLYANHTGFMWENKGYEKDFNEYLTYSKERVNQGEQKPYPTIDPKTNIPMEINHPEDQPEHNKRLSYWGLDTGVQSEQETKRKFNQRYLLGEYCKTGKCIDVGCGTEKCHPNCIGIDTYPGSAADIIANGDDLWFFEDGELDALVACHNLEHMVDTKKTLLEWSRVLKVGGILGIIVPDGLSRPSTIREVSHKVAFTMDVLIQLFSRVLGYKIIRCEFVPGLDERKKSIIIVGKKR